MKKRKRLLKLKDRAELLSHFGSRLQQLRREKGISLSQFEAMSGIDAGNLAKYEQGFREPGLAILMLLAKRLDIDPRELLESSLKFELTTNITPNLHASPSLPHTDKF